MGSLDERVVATVGQKHAEVVVYELIKQLAKKFLQFTFTSDVPDNTIYGTLCRLWGIYVTEAGKIVKVFKVSIPRMDGQVVIEAAQPFIDAFQLRDVAQKCGYQVV